MARRAETPEPCRDAELGSRHAVELVSMAAPKFASSPAEGGGLRSYRSPDHVPESWEATRPGDLPGRQPSGSHLGYQGPDQGYALALASRRRSKRVGARTSTASASISFLLKVARSRSK